MEAFTAFYWGSLLEFLLALSASRRCSGSGGGVGPGLDSMSPAFRSSRGVTSGSVTPVSKKMTVVLLFWHLLAQLWPGFVLFVVSSFVETSAGSRCKLHEGEHIRLSSIPLLLLLPLFYQPIRSFHYQAGYDVIGDSL